MSLEPENKELYIKTFERGDSYVHRDDLDEFLKRFIELQTEVQALQERVAALEATQPGVKTQ